MRKVTILVGLLAAAFLAGCNDDDNHVTAPHVRPAAPEGVYSVTRSQSVVLHWLPNTQGGIAGYRLYQSDAANGDYVRIGSVGASTDSFVVTGLANGVTRFFAVSAVDGAGAESDLSYETVYDTPRPEGIGAAMVNLRKPNSGTGWDFSAQLARGWTDPQVDVFYDDTLGTALIYAADLNTDIQDAGYAASLDHVDFAPASGWSPTGSVEVIPGHCYVVWTRDNHFAKFQVKSYSTSAVVFDWAYQVDAGNGELRARPVRHGNPAVLEQALSLK